jgi:PiT family inorganic phosphate transporter
MIGSIIGVGVANALMHGRDGTSGVDWGQAAKVGYSLLLSPLVGFAFAALLLVIMRAVIKNAELYQEPNAANPPPWWIRGILILTCSGVSFAHGSNDGQKGMGLIMLILVGTMPISYALNRAMPVNDTVRFAAVAQVAQSELKQLAPTAAPADVHQTLSDYIRTKELKPEVIPALAEMAGNIGKQVREYNPLGTVPTGAVSNVRNDMYLASEAVRLLDKDTKSGLSPENHKTLIAFKHQLDEATKFIPLWVKIAVAIALGLGTMIGWKRIVVTVGEKIGKTHLTYAQGASAELVAMATIAAADGFGLPVSTTHVLASGVAGTMAANRSGLQLSTIRNLAMAWVLTLPAAMLLSGSLYWLLTKVF